MAQRFRVRLSGREPITHPMAPVLVDTARRLAQRGLAPAGSATLALKTGRSVVMTTAASDFARLGTGDLVEVADYDPIEGILLAVGPREPDEAAAFLSLVIRHREEVGGAILVPGPGADAAFASAGIVAAETAPGALPLELAQAALAALRRGPVIACGEAGLLATGLGMADAERHLMAALARADPARFGGDAWAGPETAMPTKRRNGGRRGGQELS